MHKYNCIPEIDKEVTLMTLRTFENKLQNLSRISDLEPSIVSTTEYYKALRKKCMSVEFRLEIARRPRIFLHTFHIISRVTHSSPSSVQNLSKARLSNSATSTSKSVETTLDSTVSEIPSAANSAEASRISGPLDVGSSSSEAVPSEDEDNLTKLSDEVISFLVVALQFVSNAIVQTTKSQHIVWEYSKTILSKLLRHPEPRLQEVIGAIIYYIYRGSPPCQEEIVWDFALMSAGVDALRMANTEFWYIFFENLVVQGNNFNFWFFRLNLEDKLTIIELVENILDGETPVNQQNQSINTFASVNVITSFIQEFNKNSDLILVTTSKGKRKKDANPIEVVNLLRALCKASVNSFYTQSIQRNKSLLINCVYLLRALNDASSNPASSFAPVKKIEDAIRDRTELEASPTYGFKAALIRLVGNMMYQNKDNQNFVREHKAIEIILESTGYDARNPFIKEWSILAIRNFCEDNEENQMYIANLKRMDQLSEDFDRGVSHSADKEAATLKNVRESLLKNARESLARESLSDLERWL